MQMKRNGNFIPMRNYNLDFNNQPERIEIYEISPKKMGLTRRLRNELSNERIHSIIKSKKMNWNWKKEEVYRKGIFNVNIDSKFEPSFTSKCVMNQPWVYLNLKRKLKTDRNEFLSTLCKLIYIIHIYS